MKKVKELRYKRTMFVGLGGAGAKTLAILKKEIKEANDGKIPNQIKFLLIDTNATDLANYKDFDCCEKVCIAVREPWARYKHDEHIPTHATHEFIPKQNAHSLLALERGAGQIRSNGHFAVIENQYSNKLMRVFRETADLIEDIDIDGKTLERDPKLEVRLVFSIAGGTGSGTFLPIAMLIRAAIRHCELTAYIYSATHYEKIVENSAKASVMQNAYASLVELDYMMHYGRNALKYEPIRFTYGPEQNQHIDQASRPFEEVYYIDKRTNLPVSESTEFVYNELKRIQENTANVMHLAATNIISAHTGTVDNVRQKIMEGQFDVGDKFAWLSGVGLAEIFLDQKNVDQVELVGAVCDILAARTKEATLSGEQIAYDEIATNFIRKYRWNESGDEFDKDEVLRNFFTKESLKNACQKIIGTKNNQETPDIYKKKILTNRSKVDYTLDDLLIEMSRPEKEKIINNELNRFTSDLLTNLVKSLIDKDLYNEGIAVRSVDNKGSSLYVIKEILIAIRTALNVSHKQLEREKEAYELKEKEVVELIENSLNNNAPTPPQRSFLGIKFGRNNNTTPKAIGQNQPATIQNYQVDALQYYFLQKRIDAASELYQKCISKVEELETTIYNWLELLKEMSIEGNKLLSVIKQREKNTSAKKEENRVEVNMIDVNDGYRLLYDCIKDELYEVYKNDNNATPIFLFKKLCRLIQGELGTLQIYLSKGIAEIDANKSCKRTECQTKVERLIDLSTPTMQVDYHGYGDQVHVDHFWYVMADCGEDSTNNCTNDEEKKDIRDKSVGGLLKHILEQNALDQKVNLVHVPGWNNKAVLYRVDSAVPAYFVDGVCIGEAGGHTLEGCYEELKKTKRTYTPFSHETLRKKLENGITVLKPHDSTSEEMALEIWVNFQILSAHYPNRYIRFESVKGTKGVYSILSEQLGEKHTGELSERSKVLILGDTRKDAYDTFSRYCQTLLSEYPQYNEEVDAIQNAENYEEKFIMTGEEYMELVIGEKWNQLRFAQEDPEFLQLQKEMDFIDKRRKAYFEEGKNQQNLRDMVNAHREAFLADSKE